MAAEKIRTALVGCGKVGHMHARALLSIPEAQFIAVCDSDIARAKLFAEQYNVRPYQDVAEMVTRSKAQAVLVCTPHPVHVSPTITAAELGAHALVEKPLAATLSDCQAMITAAKRSNVKLGVISQRRWYQPVQRMKNAIESGKIGKPVLGILTLFGWRDETYYRSDPWRGKWASEGGGVLVNQAPHQIDLLQWFMGPVASVCGFWGNLNHPYIEVEDTAVAILRFQNGGLGSIVTSNSQKPGLYGKVAVHGENGSSVGVQTDGGAMFIAGMTEIQEPPYNDLWTIPGESDLIDAWREEDARQFRQVDVTTHYHALQIQDFLCAILEDRDPLVTGEDGKRLVEIFTAIYRSQRNSAPVTFPLPVEDGLDDLDGRLAVY